MLEIPIAISYSGFLLILRITPNFDKSLAYCSLLTQNPLCDKPQQTIISEALSLDKEGLDLLNEEISSISLAEYLLSKKNNTLWSGILEIWIDLDQKRKNRKKPC